MSEKITFKELIESIAEETDNSKQFTHDFLKDFVDVINEGLEQDRNVNIAGFGKFNLRRVDEREGYNPQTEEKITIPAHNKIVFKPYKNLREQVNAPYAHLESELIDEKDDSSDDTESTEEKSGEDDFIPTGPPTQEVSEDQDEAPFDLDDEEEEVPSDLEAETAEEQEDDSDIVEFDAHAESDEEETAEEKADNTDKEFDINDYITSSDESEEQESESEEEITTSDEEETDIFGEDAEDLFGEENEQEERSESDEQQPVSEEEKYAPDELKDSKDSEEEETTKDLTPTSSFAKNKRNRKRTSSVPVIAAAAVILLLVAGGAWYFGMFSNDGGEQIASEGTEAASTAAVTNAQNKQPAQSNKAESQQQTAEAEQKSQNQSQQKSATATAKTEQEAQETSSADRDSESMAIQKGQTLWSIAEDKYGNPRLWPWIYGNNGRLADPDVIQAGNSLSVPLPSGPQNTLNSADSVGVAKGYIATYDWYKNNNTAKAKDHLWAAKLYHQDIRSIADIEIDEADLAYANRAR